MRGPVPCCRLPAWTKPTHSVSAQGSRRIPGTCPQTRILTALLSLWSSPQAADTRSLPALPCLPRAFCHLVVPACGCLVYNGRVPDHYGVRHPDGLPALPTSTVVRCGIIPAGSPMGSDGKSAERTSFRAWSKTDCSPVPAWRDRKCRPGNACVSHLQGATPFPST